MQLKLRKPRKTVGSQRPAKRNRLGIAAVEFAIVAPVLLALIFMMVEVSRFLTCLNATAGAAREVARLVAVAEVSDATALQHAKDVMEHSYFKTDTVKVVITNEASDVSDFNLVSVVVTIDYSDVSIIGDPFNIGVNKVRGYSSMLQQQ